MLLILNNIGSVALWVVLYVLIRQNSYVNEPYRRSVTFGYSAVLICSAYIALIRNGLSDFIHLDVMTLVAKYALVGALAAVMLRLHSLHGKKPKK